MYYATFSIERQIYAIELGYVQEFAEALAFTMLPKPCGSVIGIANLRGQVVSVLDLKHRIFGKFSEVAHPQFAVIRSAESLPTVKMDFEALYTSKEQVALMIDSRGVVLELDPKKMQVSSGHGSQQYKEFVKGMIELENFILLVLDITKVLGLAEAEPAQRT
jgi:purine-binding chemotaxis protein CheW